MDFFDNTYNTVIATLIRNAYRDGYIREFQNRNSAEDMIKDIRIIYQGAIMWWCTQPEDWEALAATLEHLLLHMVSSRRSEKGKLLITGRLLTDMDYTKNLHLKGLPGCCEMK